MAQKGKILLSVTGFDPAVWRTALEKAAPNRMIVEEPAGPNDPGIDYAVVWKQRPGVLKGLPNLKAVFSIGAGVDHIFAEGDVPDVPIVRIVADDLTERMSEYVVWQVLDHHRKGMLYRDQQTRKVWNESRMQPAARDVTVGILGYGNLGRDASEKLRKLGFQVIGWSRTAKTGETIDTFAGDNGLNQFLALADIVVCLLPLTPATRGILSAPFFARMKTRGPLGAPILINAGRGGLQNEADILAALESRKLGAASLDVFETEPLPEDSPLWTHPRVTITPHAAAASMPEALIPSIVEQMDAHDRGEPLKNLVDRDAGY